MRIEHIAAVDRRTAAKAERAAAEAEVKAEVKVETALPMRPPNALHSHSQQCAPNPVILPAGAQPRPRQAMNAMMQPPPPLLMLPAMLPTAMPGANGLFLAAFTQPLPLSRPVCGPHAH